MLLEAQFQEKLMMLLYTLAGPEIAVASTKAYTTQVSRNVYDSDYIC